MRNLMFGWWKIGICGVWIIAASFLTKVQAQDRWFEITAGAQLTIPTVKGSDWQYRGQILPSLNIAGNFKINNSFSLRSGFLYQLKGYNVKAVYAPDTLFREIRFQSDHYYHFLSVPLQLTYSYQKSLDEVVRFSGGMSYGFLIAGVSQTDVQSLTEEGTYIRERFSYVHALSAQPVNNLPGLPAQEGTPLYYFIPALRLDITYQYRGRILLGLSYEYTLEDPRIRSFNKNRMHLHSVGFSVGYLIW